MVLRVANANYARVQKAQEAEKKYRNKAREMMQALDASKPRTTHPTIARIRKTRKQVEKCVNVNRACK